MFYYALLDWMWIFIVRGNTEAGGELVKIDTILWYTVTQSLWYHTGTIIGVKSKMCFIFRCSFMKKQTGSIEPRDDRKLLWDTFESEGSVYTMWHYVPL